MTETRMITEDVSIPSVLEAMEPGDRVAFPAPRLGSVKVACSDYGFRTNRKYSTKINRENRTIEVTRVA